MLFIAVVVVVAVAIAIAIIGSSIDTIHRILYIYVVRDMRWRCFVCCHIYYIIIAWYSITILSISRWTRNYSAIDFATIATHFHTQEMLHEEYIKWQTVNRLKKK